MLSGQLREPMGALLAWPARALARLGVGPSTVTVVGMLGMVGCSVWLLPQGQFLLAAVLLAVFGLFDCLDGTLARLTGRAGPWGATLDSTLDRFADAAVVGSLAVWAHRNGDEPTLVLSLLLLTLGAAVPYVRARAEAFGVQADVGPAERGERLGLLLVALLTVGLGAPVLVLQGFLVLLVAGSAVTVARRLEVVRRALAAPVGEADHSVQQP